MTRVDVSRDIEYVNSREVSCDGGDSFSGHPKIYLYIKEELTTFHDDKIHVSYLAENHIECPYCSKVFVYKEDKKSR